jgi:hypothetical protein
MPGGGGLDAIVKPGKEPDMIRATVLAACFFALALAESSVSLAGSEPEAPPPIDWRDYVDGMDEGDHVVGEELCAAPGGIEPVSNLPKYA